MRYLALLRGVNVGGNTMIKMAALRASFESLGFENVVSYVNSGNVAFDTRRTSEKVLIKKLEAVITKDFAKHVEVMVREQADVRRIIENNPFEGEFKSHKEMHVLFLKEEMPPQKRSQLSEAASGGERFAVAGREIYCHLPVGVADSLLGKRFIETKLKTLYTGRNWRTVEKLAELKTMAAESCADRS